MLTLFFVPTDLKLLGFFMSLIRHVSLKDVCFEMHGTKEMSALLMSAADATCQKLHLPR